MKTFNKALIGAIATLALSPAANAISFDFSEVLGGAEGITGTSVTVNGIVATGYNYADKAPLWIRNVPNDNGLGVCSEGKEACDTLGGNVNELDNMDSMERILLENTNVGSKWTSLWVSSLDGNVYQVSGDALVESGIVMWGNSLAELDGRNWFAFNFGDFGTSVEGDILTLAAAAGFDASARYLLFMPNDQNGDDNDYLVWKGAVSDVPEPTTLAIFGLGLLGLGIARRKRA